MAKVLRFADLSAKRGHEFDLAPNAEETRKLAEDLGLVGLRKVRMIGAIRPRGNRDWELSATLGATVVQDCVVTLDPVTTRIDEEVHRIFLADWEEPEETEVEMTMDEAAEPLPSSLDLDAVLAEALALALPLFPRAEGAELGEMVITEDGVDPLTQDKLKPFAGLADLKKKLET